MKRFVGLLLAAMLAWTAPLAAMPLSLRDMADVLPEWPVTTSEAGGLFVFSDSPEEFFSEGILYQDQVKGDARLFFHHVNGTPDKKRVVVLLTNYGDKPAKIEVARYGVSKPDHDYLRAGRAIQADYFKGGKPFKLQVAAKSSVLLQEQKLVPVLPPMAILTGMIDFHSDQPLQLTVAAIGEQGDPLASVKNLLVLPPGNPHLRGTFQRADRLMLGKRQYDPGQDGAVSVTLGDGELDPFLTG